MKIFSLAFRKFISYTRRGDCVKNKYLSRKLRSMQLLSCFRTNVFPFTSRPLLRVIQGVTESKYLRYKPLVCMAKAESFIPEHELLRLHI